jgi:hypothetical protein
MGKSNFFLSTLPFSPWAASATWLHVGAPHKIFSRVMTHLGQVFAEHNNSNVKKNYLFHICLSNIVCLLKSSFPPSFCKNHTI